MDAQSLYLHYVPTIGCVPVQHAANAAVNYFLLHLLELPEGCLQWGVDRVLQLRCLLKAALSIMHPAPYPPQPAPPTNTQQTAPAQDDASIDFSTLNIKQLQVGCEQSHH